MDEICVSIDLETTGYNPESDRIIEIGAVKFRGREILATFHSLINPHCPLPYHIQLLTGITPEEVEAAPSFSRVVPELLSLVANHSIVGQNIAFDLGFLSYQGLRFPNILYDTLELAHILLPQLPNHSLPALAKELNISCPVHHRALADAMTTKEVFLALVDKASQFDLPLITEINRLTAATGWPFRSFLLDVERAKMRDVSLWDQDTQRWEFGPQTQDLEPEEPVVPRLILKPLDLSWLSSLLAQNGPMAQAFPAFEHRPGQALMMQAVAQAQNTSQHLIAEAGTGIGKSIAYLLPSIFFALENNTRIIISTNTISLQEQLINKDIPDLLKVLEPVCEKVAGLRVAQLKGRSNYLCLRRWNSWRQSPGSSWEEIKFALRTLIWLSSTSHGDRNELNLSGAELLLWNRVCASEDNCLGARCPYYKGSCFVYHTRKRAETAHLIIVNHALLLSDLVKGNRILPEYSRLIIDEAHHLEDEATDQLGLKIKEQDILDYLKRLGERGGPLFYLENHLRTSSVASLRRKEIEQKVENLIGQAKAAQDYTFRLIGTLDYLLSLYAEGQGEYEHHLRLTKEVHRLPGWAEVDVSWQNLKLELESIEASLVEVCSQLADLPLDLAIDSLMAELGYLRQQSLELRHQIDSIISSTSPGNIYWFSSKGQDGRVHFCAAPLSVGGVLERELFSQKDSVVLVSATLSTEGDFAYIKQRLGLEEIDGLAVAAPFDYAASTLIYLPEDIPEPDKPGYHRGVEQSLVELCQVTQGRTLALFTSHSALRTTHAAIQMPLGKKGILVLGQGIDGRPKQLVSTFKASPKAVLLGVASLWEGIDIVGEALSVLVIAKLPFPVPTDPVFSARAELYDDSFNQYTLPQAILKFKQGFGRLIRSKHDRGVLVILDRRIQTKPYGKAFLASLPPCTVRKGRLRQLPHEVSGWLGY